MTEFPSISPTGRRVALGQFAVKRFSSISGTGTTRAYGTRPFGSSLELSFENIPDASALAIVACYEAARGSYDSLLLPAPVWSGMNAALTSSLQRDYNWRFSEQPQVTSGPPGVSSVTVRLEGQRDG